MKEGFYSSSVRRHSGSRAVNRASGHNKPAPWNAVALRSGALRHTPSTLPITSSLGQVLACKLIQENNASTVAIDNKIEQAMDLVKSHLMFAVREEVEILKENIKELTEKNNLLMEKNTQLELENNILRNAAAPETLAQLASSSATTQQQPPPTSSS